MRNGTREPYNTCSISRIHLIKSTIVNSEETKKQPTSNIHHYKMSDNIFKRTKILATIGPATFSQEKVYQLLEAGVNGIRMNFSHGANEERIEQIDWVRTAWAF